MEGSSEARHDGPPGRAVRHREIVARHAVRDGGPLEDFGDEEGVERG